MTAPSRLAVVPPRPAADEGLPSPSVPAPDASSALAAVVAELPRGGEVRHGQDEMARAVADAVAAGRHLVVRAGTGTGKTLGYLVPAVLSGKRTVVATATRALQDQLAAKDLPFLEQHARPPVHVGRPQGPVELRVRAAPGRGGAAPDRSRGRRCCGRRVRGDGARRPARARRAGRAGRPRRARHHRRVGRPPRSPATGPSSTSSPARRHGRRSAPTSRDCPGAARCPRGDRCFAEAARDRAAEADVVVVNLHLYGLDLASDGAILPEHDVAVIDEAHLVDDIISATAGVELGAGRFTHLARLLRGILAEAGDTIAGVTDSGPSCSSALVGPPRPAPDRPAARRRWPARWPRSAAAVEAALTALRGIPDGLGDDVHGPRHPGPPGRHRPARRHRRGRPARPTPTSCSSPGPSTPPPSGWRPLDVAGLLARAALVASHRRADQRHPARRASAPTSACPSGPTSCSTSAARSTTRPTASSTARPASPAPPIPAGPTPPSTSWRRSSRPRAGAPWRCSPATRPWTAPSTPCATRLPYPLLAQGDLPKPALIERFARDPETCLFATMSFWQGIDVPGPSLSLVTIDRLPFPRPDDPLLQARREHAGAGAFARHRRAPGGHAAGAGRRAASSAPSTDRGAVAVLDPRLATAALRAQDRGHAAPHAPHHATGPRSRRFLRELRTAGTAAA